MNPRKSSFLNVLKSYTPIEKWLSIGLVIAFLASASFHVIDVFKNKGSDMKASEQFYTEGFENEILRINPVYVDLNAPDRDVSRLVFNGLSKYDPTNRAIVPDLAEVIIDEEQTKYTFTLKNNIKWHDGTPVTANDAYYTFHDVIQNESFQNPVLKANFQGVEITQVDEKTIEFTLNNPNSFFITNTTVGLLPSHILKDVPINELKNHEFNLNPVGTGPYMISVPLRNISGGATEVILEEYMNYHDDKPIIKKIRFFGYPTIEDLLKNISSVNAIPRLNEELIDDLAENSRFSSYGYTMPQYIAVFMNMESPTIKSYKVRQGLQKAVFKDTLTDDILNILPVETPVLSLEQEDWRYKANLEDAKELLYEAGYSAEEVSLDWNGEEVIEETSEDELSDEVVEEETSEETEEVDVAEEEEVVSDETEEIATEEEETGPTKLIRKDKAGNLLEFKLIARLYQEGTYKYDETQKILNYLTEKWQKAGVTINIELYDFETLQQKIQARDYDLLLFGQGLGYNLDLYGYWHSSQTGENGLNLSNYQSFGTDTTIQNIRTEFDPEERNILLEELATSISEDIPAIFLYRPVHYYATDHKVEGIKLENMAFPADRFSLISEWHF